MASTHVFGIRMSAQDNGPAPEPIDVYAAMAVMAEQLAMLAWARLGLQPDMATGKIHRDLTQAKAAIDACAALVGQFEFSLDEDDRRRVHNLLRDLRVNYVEQVKENPA